MSDQEKLDLFDSKAEELFKAINKKWLKKHLKQHNLLSTTDIWSNPAAIGLVDRWLRVEGNNS
mgnify:CR=1 FL=1